MSLAFEMLLARSWREPLRMGLDLWMAAGLMRLAEPSGGGALLSAAAIRGDPSSYPPASAPLTGDRLSDRRG